MTEREAIEWLEEIKNSVRGGDEGFDEKRKKALEMGIKSLKRDDADGCTGCAFEFVEEWEMPCVKCKRGCKDYWRGKGMTNQEVITILKNLEQSLDAYCELNDEGKTAFCLAIEALNSPIPMSSPSDLISRQDALDALSHLMDTEGFRDGWTVSRSNVERMLKSLPSAEPEYAEMKKEFLRMASYIDVILECSDEQKETLIGFIKKLSDYMPWKESD